MITEQFYSHVRNINQVSLYTRSLNHMHLSVFRYRLTKNGFGGERFQGLSRNGPGPDFKCKIEKLGACIYVSYNTFIPLAFYSISSSTEVTVHLVSTSNRRIPGKREDEPALITEDTLSTHVKKIEHRRMC